MKMRLLLNAVVSLAAMTLFGCGGGGTAAVVTPQPAGSVVINGVAAKGPLNNADVRVFGLKADGTPDTANPLATGKTLADGSGDYSITIPSSLAPTGPVVVEVTNGAYTDEATGASVTLAATTKLRTVVTAVAAGANTIAVTPLTEMAYKKAEGTGTGKFIAANIDDANLTIGNIFNVGDIIKAHPFDPTKPAPANATPDDKKYAGALGVFSQMVNDDKVKNGTATMAAALDSLLTRLGTELHDNPGFSGTTIIAINAAIANFTTAHPTQTGTVTPPVVVYNAGVLTISAASTPPLPAGTTINGIDMTITLPAGLSVKADAVSGAADPTILVLSGAATALPNTIVSGKYDKTANTLHVIIVNVQPGFAAGEFMRVNFDGNFVGTATFTVVLNQVSGGANPQVTPATLTGVTATSVVVGL